MLYLIRVTKTMKLPNKPSTDLFKDTLCLIVFSHREFFSMPSNFNWRLFAFETKNSEKCSCFKMSLLTKKLSLFLARMLFNFVSFSRLHNKEFLISIRRRRRRNLPKLGNDSEGSSQFKLGNGARTSSQTAFILRARFFVLRALNASSSGFLSSVGKLVETT